MINVFQPSMGERELELIREVFASNWIGKGDYVLEFERKFAASVQGPPERFLTTTCGTEAIFLAADLFDFGPGDEILAPAVSFVAVGSAVARRGAKLVLCDVDPASLNSTPEMIAGGITERTRAVVLNHYGGVPCDMDPILATCREKGIAVIEDAACAIQAFYRGRACGTMGDMGLWSFDSMKTMSTGDGGMVYLESPDHMTRARETLYLGTPAKAKSGMDSSASGANRWWEFEVRRPGHRAIMNNVAGAIGLAQIEKLDGFLQRRRNVVEEYRRALGDLDWLSLPPVPADDIVVSPYFFWVQTQWRDELAHFLLANDVYTTFRYWPLNKVPLFGATDARVPNADHAAEVTLNLPLHQDLSDGDVDRVISLVRGFPSARG